MTLKEEFIKIVLEAFDEYAQYAEIGFVGYSLDSSEIDNFVEKLYDEIVPLLNER